MASSKPAPAPGRAGRGESQAIPKSKTPAGPELVERPTLHLSQLSTLPSASALRQAQGLELVETAQGLSLSNGNSQLIFTCPMHPEIERDQPGDCPICGMALELKTISADSAEDNSELIDMTRRFWIGAALTLPVFLLAMSHLVPHAPSWLSGDVSRWIQFVLSTPVVLWAGWPFFKRGWRSVQSRHLNMFTLIAIGVGVAYLYSAIVMLFPKLWRLPASP